MLRAGYLVIGLALVVVACIDTIEGESGRYDTPCTGPFSRVLRCGLETGGSPPAPGSQAPAQESEGPFGCEEACALFNACGFLAPGELSQCVAECLADLPPQSLFDCIEASGCNAADVCF